MIIPIGSSKFIYIALWKVALTLINPKGICSYAKVPHQMVGQFSSKYMSMEMLQKWTEENFKVLSGYFPKCLQLACTWLACVSNLVKDAQNILSPASTWVHMHIF